MRFMNHPNSQPCGHSGKRDVSAGVSLWVKGRRLLGSRRDSVVGDLPGYDLCKNLVKKLGLQVEQPKVPWIRRSCEIDSGVT